MFDIDNLVPVLLFFLTSCLAVAGSVYIVFYNTLRSGFVFYGMPWLVLIFTLGAFYSFSSINFGGQILAGFKESIVALSLSLLFFLVLSFFAFRLKKYEFFILITGLVLIIASSYLVYWFNKYQDLDGQKFANRMPDYVSALNSGDLAKIDAMIDKYKNKKIYSFLLYENIDKSDIRAFQHLAEKGLLSAWDLKKYIQKFYGQDTQTDQRVIKILIEQSLNRQDGYFTKELFNTFFESHLSMTISDIQFFMDSVKAVKFDKNLLSSNRPGTSEYSGSPGFVVRVLRDIDSLAMFDARTVDFYADCDKEFFLARYLWSNRELFVTPDELKEFSFYITGRARASNEARFKTGELSLEKKKQVLYFREKINEFENFMRK